jgi:hypothetical protein
MALFDILLTVTEPSASPLPSDSASMFSTISFISSAVRMAKGENERPGLGSDILDHPLCHGAPVIFVFSVLVIILMTSGTMRFSGVGVSGAHI